MAKKKKQKDTESKAFQYSVELTGLILILIGLIGVGGFGIVGAVIKKFAMFLVGEWWPLILMTVLILGLYMIIKRKLPKFFTSRLVGFYILFIVVLVLSHYTFIKECPTTKEIFSQTIDNFMDRIASMGTSGAIISSGSSNISIGGGIIGAAFSVAFSGLFGLTGTTIVLSILTLFGIIMLFNINIAEIFTKIKEYFSNMKQRSIERKEQKLLEADDDDDDEEEEDQRITITSVEELKQHSSEEEIVPNALNQASSSNYNLPPITLLENARKSGKNLSTEFMKKTKEALEKVLGDFGIKGTVTQIHPGPAVTQFEIVIPSGTKVKAISSIHNEIKLALAAKEIRIQAPIPGKSTVGVEIPNPTISEVRLKDILDSVPKGSDNYNVLVSLGKDIMGRNQVADISRMPHLLVAGSTGSGKSVCINSFIISILMRSKPDEVKLMLVDPKKVELSNYNGIPHLLCPVVTDPKKASIALQRIVSEMERRYELFSETGQKNITSYNNYVEKQQRKGNMEIGRLPFIVVIIDELADLMLIAAKEVEDSIMRITQMARAAGIHLIVATQRPSTDVITGVVKANIPSRISFAVASGIDSRTILDQMGAERLLGKGDMLYLPMGENTPVRIQGSFVSDDEIARVIEYVCKEQVAQYDDSIMSEKVDDHLVGKGEKEEYDDPLYNEIVEFALQQGKLSASLVQRRFRLGYNRAARIIDLLEERGIIGPPNGSKPREVLVKLENQEEKD